MDIPVIVLNWNGWEDTLRCLSSLRTSGDVSNVWLVDNGSIADRISDARAVLPRLRAMRLDQNYGWAGAYNRALSVAMREGFEFAYCLNNDCTVMPGFLERTKEVATGEPTAAAVGSRICYASVPRSVQFDGAYHPPGIVSIRNTCDARYVEVVNGAGMLVRLACFRECGGFDERFFCYHEETEWCGRVRRAGWTCALAPESIVLHKNKGSDRNADSAYYLARNRFLLLKYQDERRDELVTRLNQMAQLAWAEGRRDEASALADAVRDGLRGRFGARPKAQ